MYTPIAHMQSQDFARNGFPGILEFPVGLPFKSNNRDLRAHLRMTQTTFPTNRQKIMTLRRTQVNQIDFHYIKFWFYIWSFTEEIEKGGKDLEKDRYWVENGLIWALLIYAKYLATPINIQCAQNAIKLQQLIDNYWSRTNVIFASFLTQEMIFY